MRYFCVFFLLFSVVFPSLGQARGPMEINQWMKTGGGSLTMNILDYDDGQSNVVKGKLLAFDPWAGLFLLPNWAAIGSLIVQMPIGQDFDMYPDVFGFTAGARYYRQFYHFYFYIGFEMGALHVSSNLKNANTKINTININQTDSAFVWKLPAGFLFPLTRFLAVDGGIRVLSMHFSDGARSIESSMGYLGIFVCF